MMYSIAQRSLFVICNLKSRQPYIQQLKQNIIHYLFLTREKVNCFNFYLLYFECFDYIIVKEVSYVLEIIKVFYKILFVSSVSMREKKFHYRLLLLDTY